MSENSLTLRFSCTYLNLHSCFISNSFCQQLISDELQFHFVFLIQLRYVQQTHSLAEVIKSQHNLDEISTDHIRSIIKGETNHKVLILLDGYDEYKKGTNRDIDKAIESKIGNCFLILTSRPGNDSGEITFVSERVRNKMDGESLKVLV